MIPKGISHTSVQNPTYEFQKINISYIQENLSSIQNYQRLSFLPVTFTGLALFVPSTTLLKPDEAEHYATLAWSK
jgi:hypothetical protein